VAPSPLPQPERLLDPLDAVGLDAGPRPTDPPRRWWGRPVAELRWQAELARLLVDPVFRGEGVRRGDGTPVVLIPGFLAGDSSLAIMRSWLGRMGYDPRPSAIVANIDCSDRALDRLERRVERVAEQTGRTVALVGHSRGGHFVKALSHRRPELVCSAISIGAGLDTPFDISLPTKAAVAAFRRYYAYTSDRGLHRGCFSAGCRCRFTTDYSAPFPSKVPLTSIYSPGDGVVWWEACVVPYARCVPVSGSHVGMACNRKVYRTLADTLADDTRAARDRQPT